MPGVPPLKVTAMLPRKGRSRLCPNSLEMGRLIRSTVRRDAVPGQSPAEQSQAGVRRRPLGPEARSLSTLRAKFKGFLTGTFRPRLVVNNFSLRLAEAGRKDESWQFTFLEGQRW